ncbi:cobalamin biosynthesis protein [Vibrio sp. JC009]|uniref:cobalamin biosynthesis protein n=1 Tax=Vibrio sp. JC009 TaxID=2912314 RepID=UPI0023B1DF99|nr:cobalamin biosynthesis protein [Vibrio sp. JC009]WED24650.1 cobalamin biosynthesis protein [Vibrio sp. JC009]
MKKLAIYAITVNGAKQAARLKRALPFADLFVTEAAIEQAPEAELLSLPLAGFVADKFSQYDGHIFIFASGIVSRMIGPLMQDKRTDPAVVCLDEMAKFAISMLSGHRGGANQLTERVAHIVKAIPVITTASDVSETVSADMLGAPFGWVLDPVSEPSITNVSAAIVNDEPVIIAQQSGEKTWWKYEKRMPSNILTHIELNGIDSEDYRGAILITDEQSPDLSGWENKLVLWRPKSLVLGLGCDRNTPFSVIKAGLETFSKTFNLSLESVQAISSIDLKADEVALNELSEEMQWPFTTFAPEMLNGIEGIENPSDYVKKVTGSNSVAEAAALKLSDTRQLVVPKWAFKQDGYNMTVACCRREFAESLVQQKRKNWFGRKKHGSEQKHGDKSSNPAEIKVNAHGNEVVEGYQCKPKHVDLNRPMLHHKHHILLCEGGRCAKAGSKNLAHDLRSILKSLGLSEGDKRIKISRTMCAGACRNRSTMVIYERCGSEIPSENNALWLRNVEELSEVQWQELFLALAENKPLKQILDAKYFAPIEEPGEEKTCG